MKLYYEELAEEHKPSKIRILLVGEAPPPSGKKYFYKVPESYYPAKKIEDDTSLPGTIFNHFFNIRPKNSAQYKDFLKQLKTQGIFLIDMINEPIKIRDRKAKNGINQENLDRLFSDENLTLLKDKVEELKCKKTVSVFLLARNYRKIYMDKLKNNFPNSRFIRWKDFRMNSDGKKIEAIHNSGL